MMFHPAGISREKMILEDVNASIFQERKIEKNSWGRRDQRVSGILITNEPYNMESVRNIKRNMQERGWEKFQNSKGLFFPQMDLEKDHVLISFYDKDGFIALRVETIETVFSLR